MFNKLKKIRKTEKRQRFGFLSIFCFLFFMLYSAVSNAQCAMCRAALETEEGGVKAKAVNDGIVYLMAFPYILVGVIFYYIYKTRIKKKA
jgi:hypothetical protein